MYSDWKKIDILFIRHAESYNNSIYDIVKDKYQDIPLTTEEYELEVEKLRDPDCECSKRGLKQCEKLYEYIRRKGNQAYNINNFDINDWKIYSSPMKRCLITSQYISDAYDHKPVTVMPFLYESDGCYRTNSPDGLTTVGYPGMTSKEVHEQYPYHHCAEGMENGWYTLPHKEPRDHFIQRANQVAAWLWELQSQSIEQRGFKTGAILAIHGNLIGAVLSALMKTNMLITHHNTGYTHIELWSQQQQQQIPSALSDDTNSHFPVSIATGNVSDGDTVKNTAIVSDDIRRHRIPCIQFMNRIQHLLPVENNNTTTQTTTTTTTSSSDMISADDTRKEEEDLICGADTFNDHWIQEFY